MQCACCAQLTRSRRVLLCAPLTAATLMREYMPDHAGTAEPAGTAGQFCGLIAQYAPAFYATATGGLKFKYN